MSDDDRSPQPPSTLGVLLIAGLSYMVWQHAKDNPQFVKELKDDLPGFVLLVVLFVVLVAGVLAPVRGAAWIINTLDLGLLVTVWMWAAYGFGVMFTVGTLFLCGTFGVSAVWSLTDLTTREGVRTVLTSGGLFLLLALLVLPLSYLATDALAELFLPASKAVATGAGDVSWARFTMSAGLLGVPILLVIFLVIAAWTTLVHRMLPLPTVIAHPLPDPEPKQTPPPEPKRVGFDPSVIPSEWTVRGGGEK